MPDPVAVVGIAAEISDVLWRLRDGINWLRGRRRVPVRAYYPDARPSAIVVNFSRNATPAVAKIGYNVIGEIGRPDRQIPTSKMTWWAESAAAAIRRLTELERSVAPSLSSAPRVPIALALACPTVVAFIIGNLLGHSDQYTLLHWDGQRYEQMEHINWDRFRSMQSDKTFERDESDETRLTFWGLPVAGDDVLLSALLGQVDVREVAEHLRGRKVAISIAVSRPTRAVLVREGYDVVVEIDEGVHIDPPNITHASEYIAIVIEHILEILPARQRPYLVFASPVVVAFLVGSLLSHTRSFDLLHWNGERYERLRRLSVDRFKREVQRDDLLGRIENR